MAIQLLAPARRALSTLVHSLPLLLCLLALALAAALPAAAKEGSGSGDAPQEADPAQTGQTQGAPAEEAGPKDGSGANAPPQIDPAGVDPIAELKSSEFLSVRDVQANLPHGDMTITSGVVAIFPQLSRRLGGVVVGDLSVELNRLPRGDDTLNLFKEMDGKSVKRFEVRRAYLQAAITGDAQVEPGTGYTTQVRVWDELTPAEQQEFEEVVLSAMSDAWVSIDTSSAGSYGGYGGSGYTDPAPIRLRDPEDKEFFAAFWDKDDTRWDYRVDADGALLMITDYASGVVHIQHPWSPEEGSVDEAIAPQSVSYHYRTPAAALPDSSAFASLDLHVVLDFAVAADCAELSFISPGWLGRPRLQLRQNSAAAAPAEDLPPFPAGAGSNWSEPAPLLHGFMLPGPFLAGSHYRLELIFESASVPQDFRALGYGGVYRFDTSPLWLGSAYPRRTTIRVDYPDEPHSRWTASAGAESAETSGPGELHVAAEWEHSSRNEMIAISTFPMREIEAPWGVIELSAPQQQLELADSLDYIQSIAPIVAYYNSLWGDCLSGSVITGGEQGMARLSVFLIPAESGVEAFEDAGMVFILGGERTGIPLMAHEIAHLWWGQGVAAPRWFTEGMANYGAAKFMEHYHGPGGAAAGAGDPVAYRRYLMNLALSHELPIPLLRRDSLDDSAAIYHNSACFLLSADAVTPGGLDALLSDLYESRLFSPELSHSELRSAFAAHGAGELAQLWELQVEQGRIGQSSEEDPGFRQLVHTPERDRSAEHLALLMPAYRKKAQGDWRGALQLATEALQLRNEPKDQLFIAELERLSGRPQGAALRLEALLAGEESDAATKLKARFALAKVHRDLGDTDSERSQLELVAAEGEAGGAAAEARSAQRRLEELR